MPHLHERYDFVVSVFIVHRGRVLLVRHKSYDKWLPIGGHIELDEDPEEALYREIAEECGLKVKILADKPRHIAHPGVKPILNPSFVDAHHIRGRHSHIAFIYAATSGSADARLHEREHSEFKWFAPEELGLKRYALSKSIRYYSRKSLEIAAGWPRS
ncbi:MAG: NUDIX domain-containing protein [Candidatus Omnitrophica bacterium]|nr:NUDIX domain-containing protein [Candidatus Omnitrophota bacterium]